MLHSGSQDSSRAAPRAARAPCRAAPSRANSHRNERLARNEESERARPWINESPLDSGCTIADWVSALRLPDRGAAATPGCRPLSHRVDSRYTPRKYCAWARTVPDDLSIPLALSPALSFPSSARAGPPGPRRYFVTLQPPPLFLLAPSRFQDNAGATSFFRL